MQKKLQEAEVAPQTVAVLVVHHQNGETKEHLVFEGANTIGRALSKNTIWIDEGAISSVHCILNVGMQFTTICDLGSLNGVFINDLDHQIAHLHDIRIYQNQVLFIGGIKCQLKMKQEFLQRRQEYVRMMKQEERRKLVVSNEQQAEIYDEEFTKMLESISLKTKMRINQPKDFQSEEKIISFRDPLSNSRIINPDKRQKRDSQISKRKSVLFQVNSEQEQCQSPPHSEKEVKKKQQGKKRSVNDDSQIESQILELLKSQKSDILIVSLEQNEKDSQVKSHGRETHNVKSGQQQSGSSEDQELWEQSEESGRPKRSNRLRELHSKKSSHHDDNSSDKSKGQPISSSKSNSSSDSGSENDFLQQSPNQDQKFIHLNKGSYYRIQFSGCEERIRENLPLKVVHRNSLNFDILIMKKFERTYKLMAAILKGAEIIDTEWIYGCREPRLIRYDSYKIKIPKRMIPKRHQQSFKMKRDLLEESLQKVRGKHKVFKGRVFALVSRVYKIDKKALINLIVLGGGKVYELDELSSKFHQKVIGLIPNRQAENDSNPLARKKKKSIEHYCKEELIYDSILFQDFVPHDYLIE